MKTLTTKNLDLALNEFINKLLEVPVSNDRFTATFTRTGTYLGIVHFQHHYSDREATAQWEAYPDSNCLFVTLKYNDWLVLLQTTAEEFRTKLAETYQIF